MPLNVVDAMQNMTLSEINDVYVKTSNKAAVACLNLSGDINIGMMIRTASLFGLEKFFIMGRKVYDKRTSVGCHKHIPMEFVRATTGHHSEFLDEKTAADKIVEL